MQGQLILPKHFSDAVQYEYGLGPNQGASEINVKDLLEIVH